MNGTRLKKSLWALQHPGVLSHWLKKLLILNQESISLLAPTLLNLMFKDELDAFVEILEAHGVQVLRPTPIPNLNQIFTRDVGVTLCDKFIRSSMIPERAPEWDGISSLCSHITPENTLTPPAGVRLEGGDIMPMSDEIWMGYSEDEDFNIYKTSRTNRAAIHWLQEQFPQAKIRAFELSKSDKNPYANALHLDCCICPLSNGHAIFHPEGMKNPEDITLDPEEIPRETSGSECG